MYDYSNRKLLRRLASYKVYVCIYRCVRVNTVRYMVINFCGIKFSWIPLVHDVLYTWCFNVCTWFLDLDIRMCNIYPSI